MNDIIYIEFKKGFLFRLSFGMKKKKKKKEAHISILNPRGKNTRKARSLQPQRRRGLKDKIQLLFYLYIFMII